jgi:hypothetical protein
MGRWSDRQIFGWTDGQAIKYTYSQTKNGLTGRFKGGWTDRQ